MRESFAMSRIYAIIVALLMIPLTSAPVVAQEAEEKEKAKEEQTTEEQDKKPEEEEKKEDPDVKKYNKAIEELEKFEGAFTFYLKKADVLMEISEEDLDRVFLAQATLHSGFAALSGQSGEPLSDGPVGIFKWQKRGEKLILVRPNLRFQWEEDSPLAEASSRTFPEAILADFRIEQKHPEKKLLLVNVTSFFHGSVFKLQKVVGASTGGSASLDRTLSQVSHIKNFDENTVVQMDMHFRSQGGGEFASILALFGLSMPDHLEDSRSIPFKVTYSLWYREKSDYLPRLGDPRVGFFTQDHFNVARFSESERTTRYINRFDLKKKDPLAALSEPVEPIVWYIDKSVPDQYREGIRAGILGWNSAFEKIGFKNALVVKDGPLDDEDWDHADGRHNLVRWNISEKSAYAVAWFRTDPVTGEVLNAAVSVDANYAAVMLRQFDLTIQQDSARLADLSRSALLRTGNDSYLSLMSGKDSVDTESRARLEALGWSSTRCNYAEGLAQNAALGWARLKAVGSKVEEEEYMHAFMADLIMHEVGHCLGLRHNFAGSTMLTSAELLDDEKVRTGGLSASVMDYTGSNTAATLRGNGVFFNAVPGPYDNWAIEYGYRPIIAFKPTDESAALGQIARRSGEPGHLFLTDNDADGVNPLAVRYDLGSDTLEWLKIEVAGNKAVRDYAINKLTKDGEGYARRNSLILSSFTRDARLSMTASRFIGGVEMRRQHKGDVSERSTLAPVAPQTQRQAIKFIVKNTLMRDSIDLPDKIKMSLNLDPNSANGGFWTAPLRSIVGGTQISVLATLMSANKIDQIVENDFKLEGKQDRYTIVEHYNWLFSAVFKEIGQNKSITALRRDQQRFMINGLITQAGAPSGFVNDDVRVIASQGLVRIKGRIDKQLGITSSIDESTVLHLKDISDSIGRFLDRQVAGDR